ncbi:hypothetical protein V9T40_008125 [Parthenolecanium corni]|uniref:Uncharacterized protein n=1 Tax=Parthenolecanium corni TaxID=536013 RepID=A0AAN9TTD8_9HEMI
MSKPAKFTEYFSNARFSVPAQKHLTANNDSSIENVPKVILDASNEILTKDVNRVEKKKKLLVLELFNAETQTDQNVQSNSDTTLGSSDEETQTEQKVKSEKPCIQSARKSKTLTKISYPSPIPKKVKNSDIRIANLTKSKDSKSHCCKRKQLSNAVTVTVSSNPTSVSTNSSDSTWSALANSNPSTSSSQESNVAHADLDHLQKTVQVVVNVLSRTQFKEKKSKSLDEPKNVTNTVSDQFEKVPNWRKLFDNEEKMSESSYFSLPEVVLKKPTKVHSVKLPDKSIESTTDEKSPNLGYYIQKLLLMRPENIRDLDISSCSTATIDEVVQPLKNKSKKKNSTKFPLHPNSFDDTKIDKKSSNLPHYQNSFDDTLDAEGDLVLKSQCDDTGSVDDESIELFSDRKDQSSSKFPTENFFPPKSITKRPEKVSKSPQNLPDPGYGNTNIRVKASQDETEDDEINLPTVEELCKFGFVSEQLLNQESADEQETMEEEEFLKQLLTVGQPKMKEKPARRIDFKLSQNDDATKKNIPKTLLKDEVDAVTPSVDHKSKTFSSDLKNENRLLGWMGTTVQRTLQASAFNSTSSGDSSDPTRRASKTLENLIDEPLASFVNNSPLFHKPFTLSPIKEPDIHLTISPVLKDSDS